jgi:hypothetical protein
MFQSALEQMLLLLMSSLLYRFLYIFFVRPLNRLKTRMYIQEKIQNKIVSSEFRLS